MRCTKCSGENDDNAKFCGSCGGSLSKVKKETIQPPQTSYTSRNNQTTSANGTSSSAPNHNTKFTVSRGRYATVLGSLLAIGILLNILIFYTQFYSGDIFLIILAIVTPFVHFYYAVGRLHDMNKSGGWALLFFVPFVNIFVLLWLLFGSPIAFETSIK